MALVWRAEIQPPTRKLVLLKMADHCNDAGGSLRISIGRIARDTGLSKDQARRYVRSLEADGIVSIVANAAGGAPGTVPHYQINLARLEQLTACTDATPAQIDDEAETASTGGMGATPPTVTAGTDASPTGGTDATPPAPPEGGTAGMDAATAGMDARGGLAPTTETAGMDASLTIINHQLTTKEPKEKTRAKRTPKPLQDLSEFSDLLIGVDPQHLTDWMEVRKGKTGKLTRTGLLAIHREAEKAGLTVPAAIQFCAENNWAGFRADWYSNRTKTSSTGQQAKPRTGRNVGFDQLDYEEGVNADGTLA